MVKIEHEGILEIITGGDLDDRFKIERAKGLVVSASPGKVEWNYGLTFFETDGFYFSLENERGIEGLSFPSEISKDFDYNSLIGHEVLYTHKFSTCEKLSRFWKKRYYDGYEFKIINRNPELMNKKTIVHISSPENIVHLLRHPIKEISSRRYFLKYFKN